MKILIILSNWKHKGGAQTYIRLLGDYLTSRGIAVIWITPPPPYEKIEGIYEGYRLPRQVISYLSPFAEKIKKRFTEIVLKEKPDIIHFNHVGECGLYPLEIAKEMGIPTVITLHEYYFICGNTLLNFAFDQCGARTPFTCFVCPYFSYGWKHRINIPLMIKLSLRNITRFSYPKWLKDFSRIVFCSNEQRLLHEEITGKLTNAEVIYSPYIKKTIEYQNDKKRHYYVTGGRLVKYKGVDKVIKLFNTIKEKLIVIGSGDYLTSYKRMARANIKFTGFLNQKELLNTLSQAKVFIHPSCWPETGAPPYMILDAYSTGTPVIASDLGGHKEGIIHAKTGFCYNHKNIDELEYLVKKINKGWCPDKDSFKVILDVHNADVVGEKYITLYNSLISRK